MPSPLLLAPDNFTPATRTPWGGTTILTRMKRGLPLAPERAAQPVVGESWEVSVEPDFPSRAVTGELLSDCIEADPAAWLGMDASLRDRGLGLLVKLVDAADDLSVQIHPENGDPALGAGESGKPECWVVVERAPGAGLHLGFAEGVDASAVRAAIAGGDDLSTKMGFVPVEPGDFFVIDAGTPHAIGRGITLVEPQYVAPGRRGLTYRYWDWNRRYDVAGRPDPGGEPRALHLEDALRVTRWDRPAGPRLLAEIRYRAGTPAIDAPPRLEVLGAPTGAGVRSASLVVARLSGTGVSRLPESATFRALTVVAGAVRLRGHGFDVEAPCGTSVALPASMPAADVELDRAVGIVSSVV